MGASAENSSEPFGACAACTSIDWKRLVNDDLYTVSTGRNSKDLESSTCRVSLYATPAFSRSGDDLTLHGSSFCTKIERYRYERDPFQLLDKVYVSDTSSDEGIVRYRDGTPRSWNSIAYGTSSVNVSAITKITVHLLTNIYRTFGSSTAGGEQS